MSGQLEEMQSEISTLTTRLRRLCARMGHTYEKHTWESCDAWHHEDKSTAPHKMKCATCEIYQCDAD